MCDIREVANPDRADVEQTAKTKRPGRPPLKKLKGWWIWRKRRLTKE